MRTNSILLALSGSQQSRYAAEICWYLAMRLGMSITAHHVIDTHSAWEFIGHEKPGFLASTIYSSAYQTLCKSLFCLGEELAKEYAVEAKARNIDDFCIIDEGNPVNEICSRSINHNIVVIGHKPSQKEIEKESTNKQLERSQFLRLSTAEALAHDCPRPLLIIQSEILNWTSMSIMISMDHINEQFINAALSMAESLNLDPCIVCLSTGAHEKEPDNFVKDLRRANHLLKNLPISVCKTPMDISTNLAEWYLGENDNINQNFFSNTLLVIPTRKIGNERLTVMDSSPAIFVRYLTLASLMLFPEEFIFACPK